MEKPLPKKNSVCERCHKLKPLLMPIGWIPGWPWIEWEFMCMDCRTAVQMSKHTTRYGVIPGYLLEHSHDAGARRLYADWLKRDPTKELDFSPGLNG